MNRIQPKRRSVRCISEGQAFCLELLGFLFEQPVCGKSRTQPHGTVLNIQKFCVNDGPGIRTTVFLKGCPLRCLWCHNPETQSGNVEFMYYAEKCTHCGRCAAADADSAFVCFNGAREVCGKLLDSEEVMLELLKDKLFYDRSGGGITLSGGEPFFQFAFSMEILTEAKSSGLHTVLETCGYTEADKIRAAAEYTDLFLFDYKETDPQRHKLLTGVENGLIINNLELLDRLSRPTVLRCPIVPGYNDSNEHLKGICSLANGLDCIIAVELEPYHSLGEGKYISLGRSGFTAAVPTEKQREEWLSNISEACKRPVRLA